MPNLLVKLPLLVDMEVGEVVTLGHLELLPGLIAVLLTTLGTKEDGWHRQHRHNDLEEIRKTSTREVLSLVYRGTHQHFGTALHLHRS